MPLEGAAEAVARAVADAPVERRARLTLPAPVAAWTAPGPPPPQTLRGRAAGTSGRSRTRSASSALALIPVFLVARAQLATTAPTRCPPSLFAVIAWGDYADGIAARVTGQYSRFGALLDPVVDRLLVISGVVVCWHFELLPRWALAVLVAREAAHARRRARSRCAAAWSCRSTGRAAGRVWPADVRDLLRAVRAARRSPRSCSTSGSSLALVGHRPVRPLTAAQIAHGNAHPQAHLERWYARAWLRARAPWTPSPTSARSPTRS